MGLSIKNDEVEELARQLARRHGLGLTEVIHVALREKLERETAGPSLWTRTARLRRAVAASGAIRSDGRAFYDELSGGA